MHFKKCQPLLIAGLMAAAISAKAQQPFGAGNLVVERAGDGSAALSSAAAPVFLDEYTPTGTLVQSIAMPTAISGSNYRLTESGTASSDGIMHLSPNGKYLAITGYDAATGTASVASASGINRVVAIMNAQGVYATSTAFINMYAANNIRSAITTDSTNIWVSGTASGSGVGGIGYITAGSTTATQLSTGSTNTRSVNIFNGQLYFSTASGSFRVATMGTGIPTTAGQTVTNLPGLSTSTGSPYDFFIATFANGNQVLYIADDGSTAGIMKYSLVSGSWVANGSVGTGGDGYRAVTGVVNGNTVTLYATAANTASPPVSKLVAITDTMGYNTTISSSNTSLVSIASPGTNKVFRGVAFAPQCPAPVIGTQPQAQTVCIGTGATFSVTATGTGLTYQWMKNGTAISGATTNTYSITNTALADTGNYSVMITACSSITSANAHLTVNSLPTATITAASATTFCSGSSVVLNASTGTGYTYQWYNGAAQISGATTSSYTANASGSYTVTISNGTCSATSSATTVTVNPSPTATITAASATTFCSGGSVILNANTGTGLTYQWYNGATQISGASTSSYTATASGSYTVTVSNGTCSATSSATAVTVNPTPAATITAAGATTFCSGSSVVLNASTGTGYTYQWYNGAAQISGATTSSYTANASGSYTVTISNGTCSATSSATTVTVNPSPTATITAASATTFCSGGSVILNANTGTGLTYQWYNGATQISGASTSSYTATASGSYTVVVSNGTCNTTSAATTVNVNTAPTATATAAGATTFCQGGSVVLNANTGTGLTYQWYNGSTQISGATASSYTASASGTYKVTVANSSCNTTSGTVTVTVNPLPAATITAAGSTTLCSGGSVVLNANTGTGLTYQWYNGASQLSGATGSSYTASAAGNYTVVVSNGTCSATSAATAVTVLSASAATITPAGTVAICQGDSILLSANTGTGLTYTWKQGVNTITGATAATYKAYSAGSYTVTVSNGSCSATSAATVVNVNALPAAAITATGATTFCQGGSVVLNAGTGTGYTYQWKQGAANISGATSASYTVTASGSYSVKITDGNSCANTATATTVTVNALPANTITAVTDTTFCQGGSVILKVPAATGNTYQWKKSGTTISGATDSAYTATATGNYYVIIANAANCFDSSVTKTVTVHPLPVATVTVNGFILSTGSFSTYQWYYNNQPVSGATSQSTTATQNGSYYVVVADSNSCSNNSDTVNITNVGITTINTAAGIRIYPNPATDVLHIDAAVPVQVIIRDLTGKTVITATATNQVQLGDQPDGLYMISVSDKAGNALYNGRFMKLTR